MVFNLFKKFKIIGRNSLVFMIIMSWIFSGYPPIDFGLDLAPKVEKAQAADGDFAIYREATGTDLVNTTVTDIDWDTTITQGTGFTLQANNIDIDLANAGHYLVMYSVPTVTDSGANRSEMQSWLDLAGADLAYGSGQGYIRRTGGADEGYNHGSAIISASAGDDLRLQMQRTDNNTATVERRSNLTGISLLKLDDTWDYLRARPSSNETFGVDTNFTDVTLAIDDELDVNGFSRSGASITLKAAGHYLITYNVRTQHTDGTIRENDESRLVLDDIEIDGTRVSTYTRGTNSSMDGATSWVGIIDAASANQALKIQIRRESELQASGLTTLSSGTGITIAKLPDTADYIRLGEITGGQNLAITETPIAWDEELEIDSGSFSHSTVTNSERVEIDSADDYLFFHSMYASRAAGNATRETQFLEWRKNGVDYKYGSSGQFNRGDQGSYDARTSGSSSGIIAHGLTDVDYIELANTNESSDQTSTFQGDRMGLQGVKISSLFGDSPITKQLHFRWRDDTAALNTDGGWLAVEDSNGISDATKETTYRLRIAVANEGLSVEDAARTYEIEYGIKGSSCSAVSSWFGIANSSDAFDMVDSSNITSDGQATAALLANTETHIFTAGEARDVTDTTGSIGPLINDYYTELEYSFRPTDSAVTGETYCFRLYDTTVGGVLNSYSVYPEVTMNFTNLSYSETVMEWGTQASVGDDAWTTINFSGTYIDPIFVCTNEYNANIGNESDATADSVVCRVQSVGATSAQVRLQEPGTLVGSVGNLTAETIHWMVVEAGDYDTGDIKMEAFKYTSTVTDGKHGWVGESQILTQSYITPVVVGQVMTTNDTGHSQFWAHNGSNGVPTSASFYAGKQVSEDTDTTRSNEIVGVIVIEQANDMVNNIPYEARLQAQTIERIDDPHTNYTFNTTFSSTPTVGIISLSGVSGTDGPITSLYGATPLTTTNIYPVVMETEILDTEQSGNTEYIPYVVFESAGTYSAVTNVALDQDTFRFYQNVNEIQPSTPLANENIGITNVVNNTILRIRTALQVGDLLEADMLQFKLQYGQGAACSAIGLWVDVGGLGSGTIWRAYDNAAPPDGAVITSSLLNSQTNAKQTYEEVNSSILNPNIINDGARGEWDWVVQNNGAVGGVDYCFRMVKSDGSIMEYTQYPKLSTSAASISISLATDGNIALGNIALDTSQDTTATGINDVEVVSVDNGPADLDIKSTVFTEGANTWTLAASNGVNQVQWAYSSSTSPWYNFALADTLYTLDTNVPESTTRNIYLKITIPTVTDSYSQYNGTVTIVASAP